MADFIQKLKGFKGQKMPNYWCFGRIEYGKKMLLRSLLDWTKTKTGNSGYSVCTPVIAFRDARLCAPVTHKHTLLACI